MTDRRITFPMPPHDADRWAIAGTDMVSPPAGSLGPHYEIGNEYDGFTYLGDGWWRKGDIVSRYGDNNVTAVDLKRFESKR